MLKLYIRHVNNFGGFFCSKKNCCFNMEIIYRPPIVVEYSVTKCFQKYETTKRTMDWTALRRTFMPLWLSINTWNISIRVENNLLQGSPPPSYDLKRNCRQTIFFKNNIFLQIITANIEVSNTGAFSVKLVLSQWFLESVGSDICSFIIK